MGRRGVNSTVESTCSYVIQRGSERYSPRQRGVCTEITARKTRTTSSTIRYLAASCQRGGRREQKFAISTPAVHQPRHWRCRALTMSASSCGGAWRWTISRAARAHRSARYPGPTGSWEPPCAGRGSSSGARSASGRRGGDAGRKAGVEGTFGRQASSCAMVRQSAKPRGSVDPAQAKATANPGPRPARTGQRGILPRRSCHRHPRGAAAAPARSFTAWVPAECSRGARAGCAWSMEPEHRKGSARGSRTSTNAPCTRTTENARSITSTGAARIAPAPATAALALVHRVDGQCHGGAAAAGAGVQPIHLWT